MGLLLIVYFGFIAWLPNHLYLQGFGWLSRKDFVRGYPYRAWAIWGNYIFGFIWGMFVLAMSTFLYFRDFMPDAQIWNIMYAGFVIGFGLFEILTQVTTRLIHKRLSPLLYLFHSHVRKAGAFRVLITLIYATLIHFGITYAASLGIEINPDDHLLFWLIVTATLGLITLLISWVVAPSQSKMQKQADSIDPLE